MITATTREIKKHNAVYNSPPPPPSTDARIHNTQLTHIQDPPAGMSSRAPSLPSFVEADKPPILPPVRKTWVREFGRERGAAADTTKRFESMTATTSTTTTLFLFNRRLNGARGRERVYNLRESERENLFQFDEKKTRKYQNPSLPPAQKSTRSSKQSMQACFFFFAIKSFLPPFLPPFLPHT